MKRGRPWLWLVIVAALLAAFAFAFDAYQSNRCEEAGYRWGTGPSGGFVACWDGDGNIVDLDGMP